MHTVEEVEDAILDALEPMRNSHGVMEIKSYQDELSDLKDKKLAALLLKMPAIYVVYGGSEFKTTNAQVDEKMFYLVFVADRNVGDEAKARRGTNGRPGSYSLMDGVHSLLTNNALGLLILPLEPVKKESVFSGKGLSVYALVFKTEQSFIKEIQK